jgi:predicted nicotinamide N-methyase
MLEEPGVLALNARDDYMPYWAYVWPGAYLLAEAVGRADWEPGLEALEIGCGLGLAGLVGIAAGLKVLFTDYDEAPLRFVARSAAENGFAPTRFDVRRLDWRALPDEGFPVILGADVLYERRLVPLVVNLIDRMLDPSGVALLAGPYRVATEDLEPQLKERGLCNQASTVEATNEKGEVVRGKLHRVWKSTR